MSGENVQLDSLQRVLNKLNEQSSLLEHLIEQQQIQKEQIKQLEGQLHVPSPVKDDDNDNDKSSEDEEVIFKPKERSVSRSSQNVNTSKWKFDLKSFAGNNDELLEEWLFLIEQAFATQGFSEQDKVHIAVSYLRKYALQWYQSFHQSLGNKDVEDFTTFKKAIRKAFGDVYLQQNARTKMMKLQQSGSVLDYNKAWRALKYQIVDMSEQDQLAQYLNGLKSQTSVEVRLKDPISVESAMMIAEFYDQIKWHSGNVTKPNDQTSKTKPSDTRNSTRSFTQKPLSEVECFKCKQKGHYANRCTNAKLTVESKNN